jgi:phage shock protein A
MVVKEAEDLVQRDLPKRPSAKGRAFKEDEEIRKLANEVVSVNEVDTAGSWQEIKAMLDRHNITMPPDEEHNRGTTPRFGRDRGWGGRRRRSGTMNRRVGPMSAMKRVSSILRPKASKVLARREDPSETLQNSYLRQLELLKQIRDGVVAVATSRKRLELQGGHLRQQQAKLEQQVNLARREGREDLALHVLDLKADLENQLSELDGQEHTLQADEERLTIVSQQVQEKVEAFRVQKETFIATYTAAEAMRRIDMGISSLSAEMGEIGRAMQRAQDRTTHMQARPGAVDQLMASDAFDDVTGPLRQDIQAELDRIDIGPDIDAELERLKTEISGGLVDATGASAGEADQATAAGQPQAGEGS